MIRHLILFLLLFTPLFGKDRLFVIHAEKAIYDSESQILTLQEIDQPITFFSHEEPIAVSKTSLADFLYDISLRDQEFPAGLTFASEDRKDYNNVSLIISDPHYSFKTKELTLAIKFPHRDDTLPKKLAEVNLFVDHVPKREV